MPENSPRKEVPVKILLFQNIYIQYFWMYLMLFQKGRQYKKKEEKKRKFKKNREFPHGKSTTNKALSLSFSVFGKIISPKKITIGELFWWGKSSNAHQKLRPLYFPTRFSICFYFYFLIHFFLLYFLFFIKYPKKKVLIFHRMLLQNL